MPTFSHPVVLMGGGSSEAKISLQSGAAVLKALREFGFDAKGVEVSTENTFTLPAGTDVVFPMLHGQYGEDGGLQTDLENLGVPYVGCRPDAARTSFDKILSRRAFAAAGVAIADGAIIAAGDSLPSSSPLPLPVVVKAPRQGSSVGVSIVRTPAEWAPAVAEARRWDADVLVEAFVPGHEWTIPLIESDTVLPIVEVQPKVAAGWYDFEAKYSDDAHTEYVFPEDDPANAELAVKARALALAAYKAVGGEGMGRVDVRVRPDGTMAVLENNNVPGCTSHSILPKAAARAGIPFPNLCARLLATAH